MVSVVASDPWIEMRSLLSHSESNDRLGLGTSSVAAWFAHASCETAHLMPSKKVRFSMASVWNSHLKPQSIQEENWFRLKAI